MRHCVAGQATERDYRLFNGKNLSGWQGTLHQDQYNLAAMPEEERKAQIEKWTEADISKEPRAHKSALFSGICRAPTTMNR